MKIIDTIKSWFQNIFNRGEIANALGIPPDSLDYNVMVEFRDAWLAMYSGIEFKDVKDPKIAATVCAEAARLVVSEMECSAGDSARAKWINEQLEKSVLGRAKEITEYSAASGGIMMKPRYDGEKIVVDFVSNFYPTQYDNNGIYSCIFIEQKRIGQTVYTRIENYKYKGNGTYEVSNIAYKAQYSSGTLGTRANLAEVDEWAKIEPVVTIVGTPGPLFSYYKMPGANSIDFNSPIGVSLFSRAVDSIRAATTAYNAIDWEIEGGELKRYRDISTFTNFKEDGTPQMDKKRQKEYIFNGNKGAEDAALFETFSPELRVESQISALNRHLNQIEAQTGFSQGTFSIDATTGRATATQVVADKQKTYSTVSDIQKAFENALKDLIALYDFYATVYNLAPRGDLDPSFSWDDSVIEAKTDKRTRMQALLVQGKFPLARYLEEYEGYTKEDATAIAAEVEGAGGDGIEFGDEDLNDGGVASAKQGIKDATGKTLNGAQVTSLVGVLEKVKAGALSRAAAIALITSSFGMTEEQANKLLSEDVVK